MVMTNPRHDPQVKGVSGGGSTDHYLYAELISILAIRFDARSTGSPLLNFETQAADDSCDLPLTIQRHGQVKMLIKIHEIEMLIGGQHESFQKPNIPMT